MIAFQKKRGINVEQLSHSLEQKKKERLDQQLKDFMLKAQEQKEQAKPAAEATQAPADSTGRQVVETK